MERRAAFKELSEQTANRQIAAREAAELAVRQGAMLIGTAQPKKEYTPSILLSAQYRNEEGLPEWRMLQTTQRGGAQPAIRTLTPETAIWAAYGGDPNHSMQRLSIGRSFIPNAEQYDFATHGWRFDHDKGYYVLRAHRDLLLHTRDIDDEAVIGAIDLIAPDESERHSFTGEPGHMAVFSPQEVIGSLTVRMGDVRQLADNVELFYYAPLADSR